jgi:hypothetical protein
MDSEERARLEAEDKAQREAMEKEDEWLKQAAARWERKKAEEKAQRETEQGAPEALPPIDAETVAVTTAPHPAPQSPSVAPLSPAPATASLSASAPLSAPAPPWSSGLAAASPPAPASPSSALPSASSSRKSKLPQSSRVTPSASRRSDGLPRALGDLARAALAPGPREESPRVATPVAPSSELPTASWEAPMPALHRPNHWVSLLRQLPAAAKWAIAGMGVIALVAVGWISLHAPARNAATLAPSDPPRPATNAAPAQPSAPAAAVTTAPALAPPTIRPEPSAPRESPERPSRKHLAHHHKKVVAKPKATKRQTSGAR